MKAAEIKNLTDEELLKKIVDSKDELLKLRIQGKTGQLENSARIGVLKKDIARVKTEQTVRAQA
ncbi:MAG: 50S ribosomal protein L29 [Lentisphaeraceae bacterium]|nr:50S ribosomal protein L29 [Lentisphaeraceae bacterium]